MTGQRLLAACLSVCASAVLVACGGGGGGGGGGGTTPPVTEAPCRHVVEVQGSTPGGPGGVGTSAGGVGGTSALGAIRGADVRLFDSRNVLLGQGKTDYKGDIVLNACGVAGPFYVEVTGNEQAMYFDEAIAATQGPDAVPWRPFTSEDKLKAYAIDLSKSRGVTTLTTTSAEEAQRLAAAAGPGTAVTAAHINAADEKIRSTFNQKLQGAGVAVDDISRAPTPVASLDDLRSLPATPAGQYAQVLSALAKVARQTNPSLQNPAKDMLKQLSADLTDGVIDGKRADGQAVATAATAAYSAPVLGQVLSAQALGRLTVSVNGPTTAGITRIGPAARGCADGVLECQLFGEVITLTAQAPTGYDFTGWSGACTGTGPCAVTVTGDRVVTANFQRNASARFPLLVAVTGSGSVRADSGGLVCPGSCLAEYTPDTRVTLTPTPADGAVFKAWGGACMGTPAEQPCQVRVDQARDVSAEFAPAFRLTITRQGSGQVGLSPVGVSCGVDCYLYASGTRVTLAAMADAGAVFSSWAGACSGSSCTVTMSAARSVTARFAAAGQVQVTASGPGRVTSLPAGLDCPAQCTGSWVAGTPVTLTAVADSGAVFTGWTGGGCTGTGSCTVNVSGLTSVQASFSGRPVLTVRRDGAGSGLVVSTDGSISCGTACSVTVNPGSTVTLSARADTGSSFAGWTGGGCSGTGTCTVRLDSSSAVVATFDKLASHALTVAVTGTGRVDTSPAGIANCTASGGTCSASYLSGTVVTLSATAPAGAAFTGWGGACSGTTATCTLSVSAAQAVTASFASATVVVSGTVNGLVSTASGLQLLLNGGQALDVPAGATGFSFGAALLPGARYDVSIGRQPATQTCSLRDASGTAGTGPVTTVKVDCRASTGLWAWEGGSQTRDTPTSVVATITIMPTTPPRIGARGESAVWATSGDIWVFGGDGVDDLGVKGPLNDLWRFNAATRTWSVVSGSLSGRSRGVYGTPGVEADGNVPGARWGAASWVDATGQLWLFGGRGLGSGAAEGDLNDLWRYNPVTRRWAWMGGSQLAWADGLTADAAPPQPRYLAATWTDTAGRLWLFGGRSGTPTSSTAYHNDLWSYDTSTQVWTAVRARTSSSVAGALGVASRSYTPGPRDGAAAWTDRAGNLWLMAGAGRGEPSALGLLADLWRYQPATDSWAYMGGPRNVSSTESTYTGTADLAWPGGRFKPAHAVGPDGQFYLFGGFGRTTSASTTGHISDMWVIDPAALIPRRIAGSSVLNQDGVYGTQSVASGANFPGGRYAAVMRLDTATQQLWLFGGSYSASTGVSTNYHNDLWRFVRPEDAGALSVVRRPAAARR